MNHLGKKVKRVETSAQEKISKMLTHISRRYFSYTGRKTIFVAAGSPTHDLKAANFMRELKKKSNNGYDFVGIGGPLM